MRGFDALGEAERAVREGNPFPEASLAVLRYLAAHPGEFATVRSLQVARRSATLAPGVASEQCAQAGAPLLRYAKVAYAANHVHVEFLSHLVYAANEPQLLLELFTHFPQRFASGANSSASDSLPRGLLSLALPKLAAAGRFDDVERLARSSAAFAQGGWELARHGRPFRALALLSALPQANVTSTAARALSLFTAGRPDLAQRVFTHALPAPILGDAPFPGAQERYELEHNRGPAPLGALVRQAPHELLQFLVPNAAGAQPDRVDMALLFAESEALAPSLAGKSVVLLGEAAKDAALLEQLRAAGAQILSGPFLAADYFIDGPGASQDHVLRLLAAGVTRWTPN